jgi:hypothetical protein
MMLRIIDQIFILSLAQEESPLIPTLPAIPRSHRPFKTGRYSANTKTFRLPGSIPDASVGSTTSLDMYKPHGEMPEITCKAALCGFSDHTASSWTAILACSNDYTASSLDDFFTRASKAKHPIMIQLITRWHRICRYIYAATIRDVRISLRKIMKSMEPLVMHTLLDLLLRT